MCYLYCEDNDNDFDELQQASYKFQLNLWLLHLYGIPLFRSYCLSENQHKTLDVENDARQSTWPLAFKIMSCPL